MLGSLTEAEDAVQEAWLRLDRAGDERIENLRRLADHGRRAGVHRHAAARKSRHEDLVGEWLPEPVISASDDADDPEQQALLADSVGLALLVVLEMLSPAERLAFVLHDMFAVPFDEIAPIVGRSPETARQLASRARRRVRGAPEPDADLGRSAGWSRRSWPPPGPGTSARWWRCSIPRWCSAPTPVGARGRGRPHRGRRGSGASRGVQRLALGEVVSPGVGQRTVGPVVVAPNRPIGVVGMTVSGGRVASIELILDPAKVPADAARGAAAADAPPSGAGAFGMQMFS